MQYMGGKSRIARSIADIINEIPRRKVQNCGSHSTAHLSSGGGGRAALSACFVALVLLKVKCKDFPAKS